MEKNAILVYVGHGHTPGEARTLLIVRCGGGECQGFWVDDVQKAKLPMCPSLRTDLM